MEQAEKPNSKIVTPYSAITPEHIQSWKAFHGEHVLFNIEVRIPIAPAMGPAPDPKADPLLIEPPLQAPPMDEPLVARFVVKTAGRGVMDAVAQYGVQKNITASNKVMINNCVLGGDMDLLERYGYCYTSVLREIVKLNNQAEVAVKKL